MTLPAAALRSAHGTSIPRDLAHTTALPGLLLRLSGRLAISVVCSAFGAKSPTGLRELETDHHQALSPHRCCRDTDRESHQTPEHGAPLSNRMVTLLLCLSSEPRLAASAVFGRHWAAHLLFGD